MPQQLPLFPLSIVVYPGEQLKLHIFEPRYKQLIHECEHEGITFGIPTVIDQNMGQVATEVKLERVDRRYGGGELDVTTHGVRRCEIINFHREAFGKPYPGGEVEFLPETNEHNTALQHEVLELVQELRSALGIHKVEQEKASEITAFELAHQVGMNIEQEYHLLTLNREPQRLAYIRDHLKQILPVVQETERLKAKVKLNGHFKQLLPPDF